MAVNFFILLNTLSLARPICWPLKAALIAATSLRLLTSTMVASSVKALGSPCEKYEETTAGDFAGTILGQAANGNWYVEVTSATNCWLVLTTPLIYEEYASKFQDEKNFYNAKDDIMRCYELMPYDVFELSAVGFDGTPEAGKTLTVENKKLKVAD